MIIRSQDRRTLIVDNLVYGVSYDNSDIYFWIMERAFKVASYSTKEKAIKALDMLEEYCLKHFYKNTYDYCGYDYKTGIYCLTKEVFKFPKDEEVK